MTSFCQVSSTKPTCAQLPSCKLKSQLIPIIIPITTRSPVSLNRNRAKNWNNSFVLYIPMCLILLLMGLKADGKTVQHAMFKRCTKHISLNWRVKYAALYSTGVLGSWTSLFSFKTVLVMAEVNISPFRETLVWEHFSGLFWKLVSWSTKMITRYHYKWNELFPNWSLFKGPSPYRDLFDSLGPYLYLKVPIFTGLQN